MKKSVKFIFFSIFLINLNQLFSFFPELKREIEEEENIEIDTSEAQPYIDHQTLLLLEAILNLDFDKIPIILAQGNAKLNFFYKMSWPVFIAFQQESDKILGLLNPPLTLLTPLKAVDSMKLLLDEGADPNITSRIIGIDKKTSLETPLEIAIEFLNLPVIELLLEYGADPYRTVYVNKLDINYNDYLNSLINKINLKSTPIEFTPIDFNFYELQPSRPLTQGIKNESYITYLNELARLINQRKLNAQNIKHQILKLLREYDPAEPLINAIRKGHLNVVQSFIELKYNLNAKNKLGDSPLTVAAGAGNFEVVKLLLEAGADINIQDSGGLTPLMWAAKKGHKKVVNLLKQYGADLTIKDKQENSALTYAQEELQNAQRADNKAKIENYEAILRMLT